MLGSCHWLPVPFWKRFDFIEGFLSHTCCQTLEVQANNIVICMVYFAQDNYCFNIVSYIFVTGGNGSPLISISEMLSVST